MDLLATDCKVVRSRDKSLVSTTHGPHPGSAVLYASPTACGLAGPGSCHLHYKGLNCNFTGAYILGLNGEW
jgi:hypothetical protein